MQKRMKKLMALAMSAMLLVPGTAFAQENNARSSIPEFYSTSVNGYICDLMVASYKSGKTAIASTQYEFRNFDSLYVSETEVLEKKVKSIKAGGKLTYNGTTTTEGNVYINYTGYGSCYKTNYQRTMTKDYTITKIVGIHAFECNGVTWSTNTF